MIHSDITVTISSALKHRITKNFNETKAQTRLFCLKVNANARPSFSFHSVLQELSLKLCKNEKCHFNCSFKLLNACPLIHFWWFNCTFQTVL